jgi:hypothetical protein
VCAPDATPRRSHCGGLRCVPSRAFTGFSMPSWLRALASTPVEPPPNEARSTIEEVAAPPTIAPAVAQSGAPSSAPSSAPSEGEPSETSTVSLDEVASVTTEAQVHPSEGPSSAHAPLAAERPHLSDDTDDTQRSHRIDDQHRRDESYTADEHALSEEHARTEIDAASSSLLAELLATDTPTEMVLSLSKASRVQLMELLRVTPVSADACAVVAHLLSVRATTAHRLWSAHFIANLQHHAYRPPYVAVIVEVLARDLQLAENLRRIIAGRAKDAKSALAAASPEATNRDTLMRRSAHFDAMAAECEAFGAQVNAARKSLPAAEIGGARRPATRCILRQVRAMRRWQAVSMRHPAMRSVRRMHAPRSVPLPPLSSLSFSRRTLRMRWCLTSQRRRACN